MDLVLDYIISLTNLYGMVQRDKVVEIFNLQNDEKINGGDIDAVVLNNKKVFKKHNFSLIEDFFVRDAIAHEFDSQLRQRRGKPHYIPNQEELLRYKDSFYFEKNNEYIAFRDYTIKNFFPKDLARAISFCEEIHDICHAGIELRRVSETFDVFGISFKDMDQINEMMCFVMNVNNTTRLWENNGHTPKEIRELGVESPKVEEGSSLIGFTGGKKMKVGRNDPCPCGSGKKYKKCCLGKGQD